MSCRARGLRRRHGARHPEVARPFWVQLVPFALILGIFYFVILMPMRKRQKKVAEFQEQPQGRRQVVTTSGLYGTDRQGQRHLGAAPDRREGQRRGDEGLGRRLPGTGSGRARTGRALDSGGPGAVAPPSAACASHEESRTGSSSRSSAVIAVAAAMIYPPFDTASRTRQGQPRARPQGRRAARAAGARPTMRCSYTSEDAAERLRVALREKNIAGVRRSPCRAADADRRRRRAAGAGRGVPRAWPTSSRRWSRSTSGRAAPAATPSR